SGYGSPYYGWYDGFYYPGTGYYIYDNGGRRHRWSDGHRRYWEGRRGGRDARANWSGYRRDRIEDRREVRQNRQVFRQDRRDDRADFRNERRDDRRAFRQGQVTRQEFRRDRRDDRADFRTERRQDRQQLRRENRRDRRD
ncbi:MAG: hypothetical protein ABW194_10430, partial [Novosphingobium sp.]